MINCQWSDEELGHHLNAEAKKYIADNNIQLYTINAIDKAIEDVYKRQIVDELIATIRACKGGMAEAKAAIMEQFGFDDPQADAIVKLQLGRCLLYTSRCV